MDDACVDFHDVVQAYKRISPYVHKTTVVTSCQADEKSGRKLFFKCECQQKTGSFKARGALNAVLRIKETLGTIPGFVTFSSGNHAQALSWASHMADLPCYPVVPEMAPLSKKEAIRGYGANLVVAGKCPKQGLELARKLAIEKDLHYISSSDQTDVIAGQGTTSLEFLEQVPDLDAILVPMAGGGLAAGTAIAAKAINPEIKIYLVTPKGKRVEEYLRTGRRPWHGPYTYLNTVADGLRLEQTGLISSPIFKELAEKQVFEVVGLGAS
ncbi:serine racemase [Elysia marginata]|uniref:L-serine ammonia-lyase n=1 Tax=Elysia marginata TaxID=1093978 RepID=A0AAV4HK88_9GAST|nr:serine racemase [Elysia marginata]